MEKIVFLALLKDNLTKMDLPEDNVTKHVEVFDKSFNGKTPEEINHFIDSIGGLEGALRAIYDLESKKHPNISAPFGIDIHTDKETEASNKVVEEQSDVLLKNDTINKKTEQPEEKQKANELTREIPLVSNSLPNDNGNLFFDEKESKKSKQEMEKTTVNNVVNIPDDYFEFAAELSPLEDEILAHKPSAKFVDAFKKLRNKLPDKAYYSTLPLTVILNAFIYIILVLIFPILVVLTAVSWVLYIAVMIIGGLVAILSIVYGALKISSVLPVGLYEIGIGVIVTGITLLLCVLLYNFTKKLMPFTFRKAKDLFKLWIKANKAFFRNNQKEVK